MTREQEGVHARDVANASDDGSGDKSGSSRNQWLFPPILTTPFLTAPNRSGKALVILAGSDRCCERVVTAVQWVPRMGIFFISHRLSVTLSERSLFYIHRPSTKIVSPRRSQRPFPHRVSSTTSTFYPSPRPSYTGTAWILHKINNSFLVVESRAYFLRTRAPSATFAIDVPFSPAKIPSLDRRLIFKTTYVWKVPTMFYWNNV